MNLSNVLSDLMPEWARNAFDQLHRRINTVWSVDHDPKTGTHTSLTFTGDTQTTVGSAGGASAVPATPTGYLVISIGGTERAIPYYDVS
jgi:hypothetical protein